MDGDENLDDGEVPTGSTVEELGTGIGLEPIDEAVNEMGKYGETIITLDDPQVASDRAENDKLESSG